MNHQHNKEYHLLVACILCSSFQALELVMPLPYESKLCLLVEIFPHTETDLLLDHGKTSLSHSFSTITVLLASHVNQPFHTVLNLQHSCNWGSAVSLPPVLYTKSLYSIIHHFVGLKLQFILVIDCDWHLGSRCKYFQVYQYLHHLQVVKLIKN